MTQGDKKKTVDPVPQRKQQGVEGTSESVLGVESSHNFKNRFRWI